MPRGIPNQAQAPDNPFAGIGTVHDHAPAEVSEPNFTPEDTARIRELGRIAREQPVSNTPIGLQTSGMKYKDIAANARRMLGTTDQTRERRNPKTDKYSPTTDEDNWQSEAAQALYNDVGPGRTVVWARKNGEQADDRSLADLMRRVPEAKIVTTKAEGEDVTSWDLVAVSIPERYELMRIVDEAERAEQWEASIAEDTLHDSVTENHPHYDDEKRRANARAKARSREMGLGIAGVSPGAGFGVFEDGYLRALSVIPIEETRALEERSRRGNRHAMAMDEREAARVDDRRTDRGGRTTFGGLAGNPQMNRWTTTKDRQDAERSGGRR